MNKKGIFSLVGAGLLASSLSVNSVHAQTNQYEGTKQALTNQILNQPSMKQGYLHSHTLASFKRQASHRLDGMKSLQSLKGIQTNRSHSISLKGEGDVDFVLESEPNDDFPLANTMSLNEGMAGQLLPDYDVDVYSIKLPKGIFLTAGAAVSATSDYSNIDLLYAAAEYNFEENGNLKPLDAAYEDGVLYEAYQVNKAGTYYIGALDNDEGAFMNTSDDAYVLLGQMADTTAPAKPIVNKIDNNDKVITGKAEANSAVTVKAGSKTLKSAKVSSKGTFSVSIPVQKAGTKLSVTATDAAGNVSAATTVTVIDVVPPGKPKINRVDDNDKVVKGTAESNSTVYVKVKGKTIGSAKADAKGHYSVKIKAQKKGTKISAVAKDKAGNVSAAATTTVVKH
ncbi:Ig-like domain-containing protein [Fictibacillus sp. KU28468]|uniref:Ig-like domain-containing protein n=1 Tax=Fictibacillus sp. KU28468 TaxID=2991053 RepID=UPI00223CEB95|nr:Ig-like domain-containing protein [Fictibacillus sp. KU28468]UZJ79329.1 Ig-like domain-containing protein [Fictibacillus sp. KU28468]